MKEVYLPLQNLLRQFQVRDSLEVIWSYTQSLQYEPILLPRIEVHKDLVNQPRFGSKFFEWELELLAKEIILNGSPNGLKTLAKWNDFSEAVNLIKGVESDIAGYPAYRSFYEKNITLEMYRIAHRQFPWQRRFGTNLLVRYYKIFSHPVLNQILQGKLGLSAEEVYTIGLSIFGLFLRRPTVRIPIGSSLASISNEKIVSFLKKFSADFATIRAEIERAQSLDQDFAYAFNPLKATPIVRFGAMSNGELICPLPVNLLRRFAEGIYYEVYDDYRFANAFGESFQSHVGEVIAALNNPAVLKVYSEETYVEAGSPKHTTDWIVEDKTASLFIECKTKRVRWASKISIANADALNEDLDKMSDFVVQSYKALFDALDEKYPTWKPSNKPAFILILTLEEWYGFGDRVLGPLQAMVEKKLSALGRDVAIIEKVPYFLSSLSEFEMLLSVLQKSSIAKILTEKRGKEYCDWSFDPFLHRVYSEELRGRKITLFPEVMDQLAPS